MATGGSDLTPAVAWDRTPPAFSTARKGFEPHQVLAYVKDVMERVRGLEAALHELERERDEIRRERDIALEGWDSAKGGPYDAMAVHLADLMRNFDTEVEKLQGEARGEAERIVAEAKGEAERIRVVAEGDADRLRQHTEGEEAAARTRAEHIVRQGEDEAERLVRQAREEAERIRSDVVAIHGATLDELRIIHDHMQNSVREIETVLNDEPSDDRVVLLEESRRAPEPETTSGPDAEIASPWAETTAFPRREASSETDR